MRLVTALVLATLCAASGCVQGQSARRADEVATGGGGGGSALGPLTTGLVTVRGGEVLVLRGAIVRVEQVTYLNQPCPPEVRCIHSGIIRLVHFEITRGGAPKKAAVPQGATQVVEGVELKVKEVRPGPEASVQASLPLSPPP